MSGETVYDITSALAASSGQSRTQTRMLLNAWVNLAVSELNTGRAFSIPGIGRLVPRKSMRKSTVNPRTAANIGTRLHKAVQLVPATSCVSALN